MKFQDGMGEQVEVEKNAVRRAANIDRGLLEYIKTNIKLHGPVSREVVGNGVIQFVAHILPSLIPDKNPEALVQYLSVLNQSILQECENKGFKVKNEVKIHVE